MGKAPSSFQNCCGGPARLSCQRLSAMLSMFALGFPTERQVLFASQIQSTYDDGAFGGGPTIDPCASISITPSMISAFEAKMTAWNGPVTLAGIRAGWQVYASGRGIDDEDCKVIACSVIKDNSVVTSLNLGRNSNIGDEGVKVLASVLKMSAVVTSLDLSSTSIGDVGAAALGDALKGSSGLQVLTLTMNKISDAGAAAIADGLKVDRCECGANGCECGANAKLMKLMLSDCEIGDSGAAAIGEALKANSGLRTLQLGNYLQGPPGGGNVISDQGAADIAKGLEVNSALTYLGLKSNLITGQGAQGLATAWKFTTTNANWPCGDVSFSMCSSQGECGPSKKWCELMV